MTIGNLYSHIDRDKRLRAITKVIAAEAAIKDAMLELHLWPAGRTDGNHPAAIDDLARKYFEDIMVLTGRAIEDLALADKATTTS